jgi:hypothetical protein
MAVKQDRWQKNKNRCTQKACKERKSDHKKGGNENLQTGKTVKIAIKKIPVLKPAKV